MYVAKYNLEGQTLHQIAACLPNAIVDSIGDSWARAYESFVQSLLDLDVFFAYRLLVRSNAVIRCFVITSPNRRDITAISDGLNYLGVLVDGSVQRPSTNVEHDRLLGEFPAIRRNVGTQRFLAANLELPCDFHLLSCAARLLRFGLSSQNDLALQINCRRFAVTSDDLRLLRRRITDLRFSGALPERVLQHLSRHVDELPGRTHIIGEYVSAGSTSVMNMVSGMLETAFNRAHVSIGLSGSPVEGRAPDEEVENGLPGSVLNPAPAAAAAWRTVPADCIRNWLQSTNDPALTEFGARNTIKAGLGKVDLLSEVGRRLDLMEHKTGVDGSSPIGHLRRAIRVSETDDLAALAMTRGIIEDIVRSVFEQLRPSEAKKKPSLNDTIERLQQLSAVPRPVLSSMDLVRKMGNEGAHRNNVNLTHTDMEACIMAALRVVEWFLAERVAG